MSRESLLGNNGSGNGGWTRYLVGILWAIVFTFLTTLTANVIGNDKKVTEENIKIRQEIAATNNDLRKEIKEDTRQINEKLGQQSNQIARILAILERGRPTP